MPKRNPLTAIVGRVYLVTNLVNGKQYVGQTTHTVRSRWTSHLSASRRGSSVILHQAIRKYSELSFRVVELCKTFDLTELDEIECSYIRGLRTLRPLGYNLESGGTNYITHPETKAKIGAANRGRPSHRKGIKHKPESIEKMRAAQTGHAPTRLGHRNTPETNAKLSAFRKGKPGVPHTEEFKRRLSERNRGNTYATGIPKTPEHRAKIGAARKRFNEQVKQEGMDV